MLEKQTQIMPLRKPFEVDNNEINPLAVVKETAGYTSIFRTMGIIGGSMSSGAIIANNPSQMPSSDLYQYSFLQYMARLCNSEGYNFSVGGMSAHEWMNNNVIGGASNLFNTHPVQMYIIQLGNNDLQYLPGGAHADANYHLGTTADLTPDGGGNYVDSFFGKMGAIIAKIREVQPRAYVFLSTFFDGYGTLPVDFDYNQAIRDIVTYYNVRTNRPEGDELHYYLIDYNKYGVPYGYFSGRENWNNGHDGMHQYCNRGSHLTPTGYLYMAYEFCTYIDWIIKNNMWDFNDVAFVGTEYYFDFSITRRDITKQNGQTISSTETRIETVHAGSYYTYHVRNIPTGAVVSVAMDGYTAPSGSYNSSTNTLTLEHVLGNVVIIVTRTIS